MLKPFIAIFTLLASISAFAVTCNRGPVVRVYLSLPSTDIGQVNAYFGDGKGGIWKQADTHLSQENLDRLYTLLLTSKTTGSPVRVAYGPDVTDCASISPTEANRNFTSIWLDP